MRVLESAGVRDLFDAEIDGVVAREADLPGKPDPAVLIACARRLGARPSETIVIEDAVSGVAAGAKGRFRLVIGVDRERDGDGSHGVPARRPARHRHHPRPPAASSPTAPRLKEPVSAASAARPGYSADRHRWRRRYFQKPHIKVGRRTG